MSIIKDIFTYKVSQGVPYFEYKHGLFCMGLSSVKEPIEEYNYWHLPGSDKDLVRCNRQKLFNALGFDASRLFFTNQVHETNIIIVTHEQIQAIQALALPPDADGTLTMLSNILLTAYFADCVPLYLYDDMMGISGIAHAGWRGTVNNIASKMVQRMILLGSEPCNIYAGIGPAIGKCCYEVSSEVCREFESKMPFHIWSQIGIQKHDKANLDLKLANNLWLQEAGVPQDNIIQSRLCTHCLGSYFHSFRRDGVASGRMIGWIYRNQPGELGI